MGPDDDAPFGYMRDRQTGERRPKKRPGKQPAADAPAGPDLASLNPDTPPVEDRAPGQTKRRRARLRTRGRSAEAAPKVEEEVPPFRAGPIAKGVNKIYTRIGRVVRAMDPDVGQAIILMTRKESDDDVTVGEAWEELARTNPRIRRVLLKVISGGAWGQLVMAHAPVVVAILMKERIRSKLPMPKLVDAFFEPAEPGDVGPDLGGLQLPDLQEMAGLAQQLLNIGAPGRVDGMRTVPAPPPEEPAEDQAA